MLRLRGPLPVAAGAYRRDIVPSPALAVALQRVVEPIRAIGQWDAILRPLRTGKARLDRARSSSIRVEYSISARLGAPNMLGTEYASSAATAPPYAPSAADSGRSARRPGNIRWSRRTSAAMLAIVARSGTVRLANASTEKLDELADDFRLAQHFRHVQHHVRCGDARVQSARHVHADHVGRQHDRPAGPASQPAPRCRRRPTRRCLARRSCRLGIGADQRIRIAHAVFRELPARRIRD